MHPHTSLLSRPLTFVLAGGQGKRLFPLTAGTAKPLVRFAGVFRIIDFTLSNCVNSGIDRVYLLTDYESNSLLRYVESTFWRADLVCLPPLSPNGYRGTADSIYQNLNVIRNEGAENVLVLAADHIYKMDYRKLLRFHASHGGKVTIAAVQYPRRLARHLGVLEVNEQAQVVGFEEKPAEPKAIRSDRSKVLASMGVYVFNASVLQQALLSDAGNFGGSHDIGKDMLPDLVRSRCAFAYDFTRNDSGLGSYWRDVGTIESYYQAHMELLVMNSPFDPYNDARWPTYAGGKNVPSFGGANDPRWTADSVISPGSKVSGATITQSVIGPLAEAGPEAQIQSSVLGRGVRIGKRAKIRRAIIDQDIFIPERDRIGFDLIEDRRRFLVTPSGIVVVSKEFRLPQLEESPFELQKAADR